MGKLAINGGALLRTKPFISWPVFDETEVESISNVVRSGKWWRFAYGEGLELNEKTSGDDRAQVVLFQEEFAKYQDATYGLACANGTASMEIALKALGIGPGDEVIVPAYTYVASATCVLQVNAIPIFVDIDPDTYNINPDLIEAAITPQTRAIIPVHFSGQSADMDKILAIAKKHKLFVVEDAAHAHGSEWKGKRLGSLGDVGSFSFQASKCITAGEGGAIVSNNKELIQRCDSYIWAGREVGRPWYEFHRLGWNYRITEFQGAILRVQLTRLDSQIEKRTENVEYLKKRFESEIECLKLLKLDPNATRHSYHIVMAKYNPKVLGVSKDIFVDALAAEGIAVAKGYSSPIYKNPMFINQDFYPKGCPVNCSHYGKTIDYAAFEESCPVSERACSDEAVWFDQRMFLGTKEDMDDIINAVLKVQSNVNELKK